MISIGQLRQTGGFSSFSDAELELLLGATLARRYAPGEVLCHQGRPAASCFLIVSGSVDVVKDESGGERLLTRLEAGTIAGQLGLIDRTPRIATLRARTTVNALELTRDVFEGLLRSSSPLGYRFQLELAIATGRQLREADRRLAVLLERQRAAPARPPEREALRQLRDPVRDLDVPFDVVEITPQTRVHRF